jgi:hypothetical protein
VPATVFETSGATLNENEIEALMDKDFVVGLGEMMDYPDVLGGDTDKINMIEAALGRKLVVDGHCPGLTGHDLWGYMCAGPSSDHESLTYEEGLEKLRLGMKLMIREGSAAKSMEDFLPNYDVRWINDYLSTGQKADVFGRVFLITGLSFTGFVVWMKSFFNTGFAELDFLAHDVFAVYYRALHGIIFGDVDERAQKNYPNWLERYHS